MEKLKCIIRINLKYLTLIDTVTQSLVSVETMAGGLVLMKDKKSQCIPGGKFEL